MKTIPNVKFNETESVVSLLTTCLNAIPEGGLNFTEIRARNRVMDAIEAVPNCTEIKLEDADYAVAQGAIKTTRWAIRNKHLIQFADLFQL